MVMAFLQGVSAASYRYSALRQDPNARVELNKFSPDIKEL